MAPVADAIRDRAFYGRLIDALSTRSYRIYRRSGHDQFFSAFAAFEREAGLLQDLLSSSSGASRRVSK